MTQLAAHPQSKILRLQLRQNLVLQHLSAAQWLEFESLLEISDYAKGETLEHQGTHSMEQYFVIDGVLKRVVSNAQGKEMILRFAPETDIDTSYAAWRLKMPMPYSIRAVTKVRAAKLSMLQWAAFLERHIKIKAEFELEVMKLMSEVMAHTITLHLLNAPGRVQRFMRNRTELAERLRIPAVLGEIAAGIAIGPSALGLVDLQDARGVSLVLLAELGVLLLLLLPVAVCHLLQLLKCKR